MFHDLASLLLAALGAVVLFTMVFASAMFYCLLREVWYEYFAGRRGRDQ